MRVDGATVHEGGFGKLRPRLDFACDADLPDIAGRGAHCATCHPKRAGLVERQPHRGHREYCKAAGLTCPGIVAVDTVGRIDRDEYRTVRPYGDILDKGRRGPGGDDMERYRREIPAVMGIGNGLGHFSTSHYFAPRESGETRLAAVEIKDRPRLARGQSLRGVDFATLEILGLQEMAGEIEHDIVRGGDAS